MNMFSFFLMVFISIEISYSDMYMLFLSISNTFISNARLKLANNLASAKQHSEAELLLFENYSHFSFTSSFKNNRTCSKLKEKNK